MASTERHEQNRERKRADLASNPLPILPKPKHEATTGPPHLVAAPFDRDIDLGAAAKPFYGGNVSQCRPRPVENTRTQQGNPHHL
jgi:hypothetical protein